MGSDSDWPTLTAAAELLDQFGIDYEVEVVSAHRTPERMVDYAKTARARGLKVIIAGAGGAAHLPGMTASLTSLPVIGVPVSLAKLDGMDSLLSIVQMPAGYSGSHGLHRGSGQRWPARRAYSGRERCPARPAAGRLRRELGRAGCPKERATAAEAYERGRKPDPLPRYVNRPR